MRNSKGITLMSLLLYVCVLIIMLSTMSLITAKFYNNTETVQEDIQERIEFNKFNSYFLKEVKTKSNQVEKIPDTKDYILFSTGNSFKFDGDVIYFNNSIICEKVKNMSITQEGKTIKVKIIFKNLYVKEMNYTLENMY